MKRSLTSVFMVIALVVVASTIFMPQAQAYDQYLNGDTNYAFLYERQGVVKYLDKSSVVIKQNNKDAHAFAENIVIVDANGNVIGTQITWYYQAINRDNYTEAQYSNDGKSWRKFDVNDSVGFMQVVVNGFKVGWKVAFGSGWS